MALNQPQLFLIAYDIREPRRLGRVHRFLRKEGLQMFPEDVMLLADGINLMVR